MIEPIGLIVVLLRRSAVCLKQNDYSDNISTCHFDVFDSFPSFFDEFLFPNGFYIITRCIDIYYFLYGIIVVITNFTNRTYRQLRYFQALSDVLKNRCDDSSTRIIEITPCPLWSLIPSHIFLFNILVSIFHRYCFVNSHSAQPLNTFHFKATSTSLIPIKKSVLIKSISRANPQFTNGFCFLESF